MVMALAGLVEGDVVEIEPTRSQDLSGPWVPQERCQGCIVRTASPDHGALQRRDECRPADRLPDILSSGERTVYAELFFLAGRGNVE